MITRFFSRRDVGMMPLALATDLQRLNCGRKGVGRGNKKIDRHDEAVFERRRRFYYFAVVHSFLLGTDRNEQQFATAAGNGKLNRTRNVKGKDELEFETKRLFLQLKTESVLHASKKKRDWLFGKTAESAPHRQ